MNRKINRSIMLYPWFQGLLGDLLFYIAIDTLFFTADKGLSAAQIVSLATVSNAACILLNFPILYLMRRIGNTASTRISALLLLLAALSITFGNNYYWIAFGRILHGASQMFHNSAVIALENNLTLIDKDQDFVRVRASGNIVYSVLTMIVSLIVGPMFNWNHYLPMYCCIAACATGFLLTLLMADHSPYDRVPARKAAKKQKLPAAKMIILSILAFGLFYPIVHEGQSDGKLFIQQQILESFTLERTTIIISSIVFISRVVRIVANVLFPKIYRKTRNRTGILLTGMLFLSIACLLGGSFLPWIYGKICVMCLGYIIILFIRDPFKLYIQDVILNNTKRELHQAMLAVMQFAVKVGTVATSLYSTLILLEHTMREVMAVTLFLAALEIGLCLWLYRMVTISKNTQTNQ